MRAEPKGQGTGIEFPVLAEWLKAGAGQAENSEDCRVALLVALQALDEAGVMNGEQLKDLLYDYGALAEQAAKMHLRYEVSRNPRLDQDRLICPECGRQVHPANNHCCGCGQKLR